MKHSGYLMMAWFLTIPFLPACTVVKVVDLTASAALGVGKGAVKATSATVGVIVPDGAHSEKKNDE